MKTVGKRRSTQRSPAEALRLAEQMIREAERLAGRQRSRPFVLRMPTREAYEEWKRAQRDPRYW